MYAALRVLEQPATEPVTVAQARKHCRIDADYDDDLIETYIASARQWAESFLNRALFTQRLEYQVTWAPPPTATPLVPQSLIVFPLNWPPLVKRPIELPRAPTQEVESIWWGPVDDMQRAEAEDYTLNLGVEPATVNVKPQILPRIPQQSMIVTYKSGYHDSDPAMIPAPIRHAILLLVAYLYEQRGDIDAAMPNAARLLMGPYRLWSYGNQA